MPPHDNRVALRHMRDYARTAVRMVADRAQRDLDTNEMLRLALTRAIEVIGNAAARVPTAAREKYPNIPWSQIVSVRNRLIHGYDTIDLVILWDITTLDLPPLIAQLDAILSDESEPRS